jgi:predicted glycogen debranching enzyme
MTILAGYPWFADWGRDAMISLPGLLLTTGRYADARRVLAGFARHARDGIIPNCFDDKGGGGEGGGALYNPVDASLWFVHAACASLSASGDREGFRGRIRDACLDVIDAYKHGTTNIRMDDDALIAAGDETTQLTWMDAKRDGVTFTPRHGKAVEINALWHHDLLALADAIEPDDAARADELRLLAGRVAESFRRVFWNEDKQCCFDAVSPDGTCSGEIRPNQIFAVSLEHSPLDDEQQRGVVEAVRRCLLTRHGLRTLDPAEPGYHGRYEGSMFERDAAYHNGTVWPWLIGPYVEAVLRVGRFSVPAIEHAREALAPLIAYLQEGRCPGQLPEVFDGDDTPEHPQRPDGCPAQAWSVAEVLRAYAMVAGHEPS